jgi:membrane fusion protein (multidrug efflux system)
VEVAQVAVVSLQDDVQAVGSLRSRQSVMLRPEVAGRVAKIAFADGTRVKKGQLLVQLDDVLQQAELSQAQAQVSIARANLKRNQELVAAQFVAPRVVEESQAALQVAEAQLSLAQARLARMRLVAPFDGTLGLRMVNLGDYVKDGADLVNLEDTSTLYVDFRVPERYQGKLATGQRVKVALDALPGQSFEAKVVALDPLLDANGRSLAVRALLPNAPQAQLRPGMFARTTTVFAVNEHALTVPEEAIVPQGGKQFVHVVKSEGEGDARRWLTHKVEVTLGMRRASTVQVVQGLSAGDTVVVAGQQRLQKDNTVVRVVDLSAKGGPRKASEKEADNPMNKSDGGTFDVKNQAPAPANAASAANAAPPVPAAPAKP